VRKSNTIEGIKMIKENLQEKITEAYNSETFKEQGYKMIDMLSEYLANITKDTDSRVFSNKTPRQVEDIFKCTFQGDRGTEYIEIEKDLMREITPLHSPHFLGHQVSSPLPLSALSNAMMSLLNNSNCVYEMGRGAAGIERAVTKWMCKKIGYNESSDGFLTSGGTLGNLTALLSARQAKAGYDIWSEGVKSEKQLAVLVSEQSHYSVKRAAAIMGIGNNGAISVASDKNYRMDINALKEEYTKAKAQGKEVFAVVANSCSTATGTYDDLESIAEFCKENNLWLHADGAHGAAALLSDKHRGHLKGIEHADSVVWDAHKMMMLPALATGVLFKNGKMSRQTFSQNASYILDRLDDSNWYDYGLRTMECTKPFMSLNVYSTLKHYGEKFFGDYIDYVYELTKEFANFLESSEDFEIAVMPESNIICFRYINSKADLNDLQIKIREKLLDEGNFYIVKTGLRGKTYLRCTIINPYTDMSHLKALVEDIRKIAADILHPVS